MQVIFWIKVELGNFENSCKLCKIARRRYSIMRVFAEFVCGAIKIDIFLGWSIAFEPSFVRFNVMTQQ